MKRVMNHNFEERYPEIEKSLRSSTFVALDAEFSGLSRATGEDSPNQSLFDSPAARYAKLRHNIEPFAAIQFGLTMFTHMKDDNKYAIDCYQFHLFPRAIPATNRSCLFQSESLEFLCSHDFDFNKLAYDGISYLNEPEEAKLREILRDSGPLEFASQSVDVQGQDEVDAAFVTVRKWLNDAENDEKFLVLRTSSLPVQYLMHQSLRQSFKGIWTESKGLRNLSVIKVTADVRKSLEEEEIARGPENELLDYYMGFSRIMRLMKDLKKPIVGHNLLLDLMFIHKQFFWPLPKRYETFKSNINQLFPLVYDTKFLSYELKSVLNATSWKSNGLAELFSYFRAGPGRHLALNSPRIGTPGDDVIPDDVKFHDASWDAYCTGYCFIRMAHIYTAKKLSNAADLRIFTNTEIMSGVKPQANRINLIRADLSYLQLDGSDPASTRPRWLHVRTTTENLCIHKIARTFARFGPVDVKRSSANCVLVAVPNHGTAREILKHYASHSELRVAPYDSWRHSPRRVSVLIWAGSLILSGAGIAAWLLNRSSSLPSKPLG